jgi:hypothetical protein
VSDLLIDAPAICEAGAGIRDVSRMMPDPGWGPSCASGSADVDAALRALTPGVVNQLLGAAGEMFRIGQGTADAVQVFLDTDAAI